MWNRFGISDYVIDKQRQQWLFCTAIHQSRAFVGITKQPCYVMSSSGPETDGHRDFGPSSTKKALKKGGHVLRKMRVAILRSIKSLVLDRVPARRRKSIETRYAKLLPRVAITLAAVQGEEEALTVVHTEDATNSRRTVLPPPQIMVAAVLLTDIYRLEQQLKEVDEERDRLTTAGSEDLFGCRII